ncbi:MAG TPA: hypothetical protein VFG95_05245 [Nitrospiria bacterium]|nr:hypothetical protein [Nitrospiria bacterium]
MLTFFPVINHWLHLMSAVIWVGGLAFQVFVFFPSQRKDAVSEPVLKSIANRFRMIVGPLIMILIVTGGINLHNRRLAAMARSPGCGTDGKPECIPAGYTTALSLKLLFVVGIISIYLFDVMNSRREGEPRKSPADGIPTVTRISLILGLLTIFMAAMLRHWQF